MSSRLTHVEYNLLVYILDNARDGRLVMKVQELANAIKEPSTTAYSAIRSLANERHVFETHRRSKQGLEFLINYDHQIVQNIHEYAPEPIAQLRLWENNEPSEKATVAKSPTTSRSNPMTVGELYTHVQKLGAEDLMLMRDIIDRQLKQRD